MSNIVEGVVEVYRKATDISAKIQAAAAGGVTVGSVTSVIDAVNPNLDLPAWAVGLITLAGALVVGYLKKDTVKVSTIAADGTVTENATVDLGQLPELEMPDFVKEALDAQENLGKGEEEQAAGIPK